MLVPGHVEDAPEPGVYPSAGAALRRNTAEEEIDEWAVAYLETGLHLRHWEELCKDSEHRVEAWMAELIASAALREAQERGE